jgi:hypothetical protein
MYVSLTPELERLVNEKVESGLYQTASEVVRRPALISWRGAKDVPSTRPQAVLPGGLSRAVVPLVPRNSECLIGYLLWPNWTSTTSGPTSLRRPVRQPPTD